VASKLLLAALSEIALFLPATRVSPGHSRPAGSAEFTGRGCESPVLEARRNPAGLGRTTLLRLRIRAPADRRPPLRWGRRAMPPSCCAVLSLAGPISATNSRPPADPVRHWLPTRRYRISARPEMIGGRGATRLPRCQFVPPIILRDPVGRSNCSSEYQPPPGRAPVCPHIWLDDGTAMAGPHRELYDPQALVRPHQSLRRRIGNGPFGFGAHGAPVRFSDSGSDRPRYLQYE